MKQFKMVAILVAVCLVFAGMVSAFPGKDKDSKDRVVIVNKDGKSFTVKMDLSNLAESLEALKDIKIDVKGLENFGEEMEALGERLEKQFANMDVKVSGLDGLKTLKNLNIKVEGLEGLKSLEGLKALEALEDLDIKISGLEGLDALKDLDIDIHFDDDDVVVKSKKKDKKKDKNKDKKK